MRPSTEETNTTAAAPAVRGTASLPSVYDVLETRLRLAILESMHPQQTTHQQATSPPYHVPHCTMRPLSVSHECLCNEAIMVRIFELMQLHPRELLALRQVCKPWYDYAQSELLWWQYREQILAGALRKELRLYPSLVDGTATMPPLKTAVLFMYANATRTGRVLTARLSTLRTLAKHTRYPILQPHQNALMMDVVMRKRHEINRRKMEFRKRACFKIGMPSFERTLIDNDDVVWDESPSSSSSPSSSDADDNDTDKQKQRKRSHTGHGDRRPSTKKQRQTSRPAPSIPGPPLSQTNSAIVAAASGVSAPTPAPAGIMERTQPPQLTPQQISLLSSSLASYRYESGILKSTVSGGDDLVIVEYRGNIPLLRRQRSTTPLSANQQQSTPDPSSLVLAPLHSPL